MPVRGLPAPLVTTTPVNHLSLRPKHSATPWYAMISMSSWCAEMHRWVVRAMAASGEMPSGTKKSAVDLWYCINGSPGWQWTKGGGGDSLAVGLLLLVGDVISDALGDFGELGAENFAGGGEDQVAARAGEDAAE